VVWLLIFAILPQHGFAQKFETVKDEQNGRYIAKVHFKLPPKAIDSARIASPLVWEFHERTSKNAAPSYMRAHYYLEEYLRKNMQHDYQRLLTAIWEKAEKVPVDTEELIRQTIKSPIQSQRSAKDKNKSNEELTPEELRRQQQTDFVSGISSITQDYAIFSLHEHPEQLDAVKKFVAQNELLFRCLEEGSRCEFCDFGIPFRETNNPLGLLLPDIQNMRKLTRALRVKIMLEIHEKRFNDALKSIRIGLAMARHTGKQPTLVCGLIGITIHNIILQELQNMMSDRDCPNLFWETATIPHPFLNFIDAAEIDKELLPQTFPVLRKAMDTPESISDEEWRLLFRQMIDFLKQTVGNKDQQPLFLKFPYQSWVVSSYPAARQYLLAQGKTAKEIDTIIPEKVVGLHSAYEIKRFWNKYFRVMYLPLWEKAEYNSDEWDEQWRNEISQQPFSGNWFSKGVTEIFLPAIKSARMAYRRMELSSDIMRIAAAIQDYAAQNHGNVPVSLDEIKNLPIPNVDPASGKTYDYNVINSIGQINVSNITPINTVEFEIVK
ncbi:MAG: hypothetical protein LBC02_04460, partial [Planctomycetaceae bacterium]|nr:hypothetical protein [Planctomycetaceae bacterium]